MKLSMSSFIAALSVVMIVDKLSASFMMKSGTHIGDIFLRSSRWLYYKSPTAIFDEHYQSVVFINTRTESKHIDDSVHYGFGTGFIWDKEGHIVTHVNVVDETEIPEVTITLPATPGQLSVNYLSIHRTDKFVTTTYKASVTGVDLEKGIVVLKVNSTNAVLPTISEGNFNKESAGEPAYTIINPSVRNRRMISGTIKGEGKQAISPFGSSRDIVLETDIEVDEFNLGGPLLDASGRLIGLVIGNKIALPLSDLKEGVENIIAAGVEKNSAV